MTGTGLSPSPGQGHKGFVSPLLLETEGEGEAPSGAVGGLEEWLEPRGKWGGNGGCSLPPVSHPHPL